MVVSKSRSSLPPLGGCISPESIWEIIQRFDDYHIAPDFETVQKRMTYKDDDTKGFSHFLDKFSILDEVHWDAWAIDKVCSQICQDAARKGTAFLDISFSVDKYVRSGMWSYTDVIDFIGDCFRRHSETNKITVGPFLSISYHAERDKQIKVANLIDSKQIANHIVGLDLVGDERLYDSDFFGPIIAKWNKAGKITREHIAEVQYCSRNLNKVLSRPPEQRPQRIAHGIMGSIADFIIAAKYEIYFDLALTSNIVTGAVELIQDHPIKQMIECGCLVTINTDDPIQFDCDLDHEYNLAINNGLITQEDAYAIQRNATVSLRR